MPLRTANPRTENLQTREPLLMRKLLFFLTGLLLAGTLPAQSSLNLSLIGHLPNDTLSNGLTINANDIWGYVDNNGREYALVGKRNGLSIVSLENPSQPQQLFFSPGTPSVWRDIKTFGGRAYICNDDGGGIKMIDLSNLPTSITVYDSVIAGVDRAHNLWIEGDRLYVIGSPAFNGGMGIYSLSNPLAPQYLGQYDARYVHDAYVRNKIAYLAEIYAGSLTILDCSDPALPVKLGETTYPGAFTHNTWLNDAGTVCFTTDEIAATYIRAWDITDPGNIEPLGKIRSSVNQGNGIPHNVHVLDDYLITSYYSDGIHLVDASRPQSLVEIGYYKTGGSVWGAYPFLPSGIILASDILKGLYVLAPAYQRAAFLEGTVVDSLTGKNLEEVSVQLSNGTPPSLTDVNGFYQSGTLNTGTFQVSYIKFGYRPAFRTVDLAQGQAVTEDIQLNPRPAIEHLQLLFLDSLTGLPVEELIVHLEEPFSGYEFETRGEQGIVEFEKLPTGPYLLTAGKWGYQTRQWELELRVGRQTDTLYLLPGYYDDFSLDFNWLSQGTTVAGSWEMVSPRGAYEQDSLVSPAADIAFDFGNRAAVTQNALANGSATPVRGGQVSWVSPPFDFRAYENPYLYYYYWFAGIDFVNDSIIASGDSLLVRLVGQDTSMVIREYAGYHPHWQLDSIRIADYKFQLDSVVHLHFVTANRELAHTVEAAIDLVWVTDRPLPVSTTLEKPQGSEWLVFPNPVQDQFFVRQNHCVTCRGTLRLYDLQGRLLAEEQILSDGSLPFPYSSGVYLLELTDEQGARTSRKIVKR